MSHLHHTIDYVELAVSDLPATRAFYSSAFGWEFNDYGDTYAGIRSADGTGEVGGLNATATPARGGPLVLLWSADLDATVRAVEAAGGEVVAGPYEFPGGRRFHFLDPSGNELGVWADA
ncbi:VOC family protein [Nocardioides euryhalodurans]|nr:VOC family protein [Nocardioides euryhalodurans]